MAVYVRVSLCVLRSKISPGELTLVLLFYGQRAWPLSKTQNSATRQVGVVDLPAKRTTKTKRENVNVNVNSSVNAKTSITTVSTRIKEIHLIVVVKTKYNCEHKSLEITMRQQSLEINLF